MGTHITFYIDGQDVGAASTLVAPSGQGVQRDFRATVADLSPELLASLQRYKGKFSALVEAPDGRQYVLTNASVIGSPSTSRVELQVESGGWGIGVKVEV